MGEVENKGKIEKVQLGGFMSPREPKPVSQQKDQDFLLSQNALHQRPSLRNKEKQEVLVDTLPTSLSRSGNSQKLHTLLTNVDFLMLKLAVRGIESLLDDFNLSSNNQAINKLHALLTMAEATLKTDPYQFPEQVLGRLENEAFLELLITRIGDYKKNLWLKPRYPSLSRPEGAAVRIIDLGSEGFASGLAITPDNVQVLVIVGEFLYAFDLNTGRQLFRVSGSESDITDLTVTADGQYAVAVSRDGNLIAWSLITKMKVFSGAISPRAALAIEPITDSLVIVAATDGKLRIWDVASNQLIRTLDGHKESANCVAVLADKRHAISGGGSTFGHPNHYDLKLWNLETGHELASFGSHEWPVDTVAVTPQWIASAANESLYIWNLDTHQSLHQLKAHAMRIQKIRAIDAHRLVSVSTDGALKVWNLETGQRLAALTGHHGLVSDVSITSDQRYAASIGWDQTLRLWNLARNIPSPDHDGAIKKLAIAPSGTWVATASEDHTIKIWSTNDHHIQRTLSGHTHWVSALAISANGQKIISGAWDNTIRIWDLITEAEPLVLQASADPISALAFHPSGDFLVAGTIKGDLFVWDVIGDKLNRTFHAHTKNIEGLILDPTGEFMFSVAEDRYLRKWNIKTGTLVFEAKGYENRAALAEAEDDDERLFIRQMSDERLTDVVIAPDGKSVVTCSWNGWVSIWNSDTGELLSSFENGSCGISALVVSADGRFIATTTGLPHYQSDNTVWLWHRKTQKLLARFVGDAPMSACGFTPDNQMLIVGDTLGKIHFLEICNAEEIDR